MNKDKPDVLIIDDDPDMCNFLYMQCKKLNIFKNIIIATDGLTGFLKMQKQDFGLIILDIHLPKKRGNIILDDLKLYNFKYDPNKVLVVSANMDKNIIDGFFYNYGIKNFMIKPIIVNNFEEKIFRILNKFK